MKRLLAAAITVLAFLAGLLVQGGLAAPDIENLTDAVCTGADGMVYTAGFGQTTDGIYGIGDGGRILEYVASGEDGAKKKRWSGFVQMTRCYTR